MLGALRVYLPVFTTVCGGECIDELTCPNRLPLSCPSMHEPWGLGEARVAEAVLCSEKMPDSSCAQMSLSSCAAQVSELLKNR